MRVLIWLVLACLVYFAVRSKVRSMQQNMRESVRAEFEAQAATQKTAAAPAEDMVACTHCHVYLPASEAVKLVTPSTNQFFCSEDHLRIHNRAPLADSTATATVHE